MWRDDLSKLIGRRVSAVYATDSALLLEGAADTALEPSGGDLRFRTEGECCSETWIDTISGADKLIGHAITNAENFDPPAVKDTRGRQEDDHFYGLRITTEAGACEIVYRNSSNGYYGGSLEFSDSTPDKSTMTRVETDWRSPDPKQ